MAKQATRGTRRACWLLALCLLSCENAEPFLAFHAGQAEGLGVYGSGPHTFAEEDYLDYGVSVGVRWARLRAPQAHPMDQELLRGLVRAHREVIVPSKPQGPQGPSSGASSPKEKKSPPDTHDGHGVWIDVMAWFIKTKWGPGQIMALALLVLAFGMFCVAGVVYLRRRRKQSPEGAE